MKKSLIIIAAAAGIILCQCTQPKRIFHGNYEVATPMSEAM